MNRARYDILYFTIHRSDDEPEVSTSGNKTVVFQTEHDQTASKDATKQSDIEKKKKKSNKSASVKTMSSHQSTEVTSMSYSYEKPVNGATNDAVIDHAPDKTNEEGVTNDAKSEKGSQPDPTKTQKQPKPKLKLKPKPKIKLIKPPQSAGTSKFGKIKFDKNFAKKPHPNVKIVKSSGLTDERLKAFGINPRRYNWKLKHSDTNQKQKEKPNNNKHPNNNKKFTSPKNQLAPPNKKRKIDSF